MREVLILFFVVVLVLASANFADRALELELGTAINFVGSFALLCGCVYAYRRWKQNAKYRAVIDNPDVNPDVVGPETKTHRGSNIDLHFDD